MVHNAAWVDMKPQVHFSSNLKEETNPWTPDREGIESATTLLSNTSCIYF